MQQINPTKLAGKTALVTGGGSGIGRATANRFVAEGAKVFISGRRIEELEAAVAEIGGDITAVRADITKTADLDRLYATIAEKAGGLDILFANAGSGTFLTLDQTTEEHVDRYLALNIKGTLFTVQKALPLMKAGGSIVLNGSIAAVKGVSGFGVYSATKAALRSFARTWAVEFKDRGIRVNVVAPGTVVTKAYETELGMTKEQVREFAAQAAAATPLGRTGEPDEIAKAVSFLASDDASYITGIELFVDGGSAQI